MNRELCFLPFEKHSLMERHDRFANADDALQVNIFDRVSQTVHSFRNLAESIDPEDGDYSVLDEAMAAVRSRKSLVARITEDICTFRWIKVLPDLAMTTLVACATTSWASYLKTSQSTLSSRPFQRAGLRPCGVCSTRSCDLSYARKGT